MLGPLRPRRVALLGVVVLAVGGWIYWRQAGRSTPVGEIQALRDFRARESPGPVTAGTPAPGVYTYRQTGSERGGFGPLNGSRTLPGQARLIVNRTRDGYEAELDLAAEHIEARRYRLTPAGLAVTWIRTKLTFAGFGRDDRRVPTPNPLFLPSRPRVGQAWRTAYRTGEVGVTARAVVLRAETLRLGGEAISALVVRTTSRSTGPHPGTQVETIWWSPRLALPVRWILARDITGIVSLRVADRLELESATPAT